MRWQGGLSAVMRWLLAALCTGLILLLPLQPTWAATTTAERTVLTLDLLQERLRSPTTSEGVPIIDLGQLVIDLRPENSGFRDQFYIQLQTQLQRPGTPTGLDLSRSRILGEFDISQIGLRAPLYGQALSPIFTPAEQEQLERDRRRLLQLSQLSRSLPDERGSVLKLEITVFRGPLKLVQTQFNGLANFTNTFFLNRVEAQGAIFTQAADWSQTRFSQTLNFIGATFWRDLRFRSSIFFVKARFNQVEFRGIVNFQGSEFQNAADFNQADFRQVANFSQIQWLGDANFSQAHWHDQALFSKDKFAQSCLLNDTIFEKSFTFREAQLQQPVNLHGTSLFSQADFSDVGFAPAAYLNIPNLKFDSEEARILGNPGQISRVLSVPTLQGNENLLRNLVRNFRQLEQVSDANYIEYMTEQLRLQELKQALLGTNINTASIKRLMWIGFSQVQAEAIAKTRIQQPFRNLSEILTLEGIDLETYLQVSTRAVARESISPTSWLLDGLHWLGLSLLLLLSHYGTNFWLIFGVGIIAIACFGVLFWLVDRFRRLHPQPIVPTRYETAWIFSGFGLLMLGGLSAIFRTADYPWLTLACLGTVTLPIPAVLLFLIYQRGRYHDLMDLSYFVEDGSMRQFRLLIGRLPLMPRFVFFRDRYMPLLWDRRWNWLNYYDFSLNNLLKFGFNDIRLRDEHLPGLISSLAWYQWSLGLLYIALLLWTLSRTIPGLNLLIYFK